MTAKRFPVDVLLQRVPLAHRWVSERWQPIAVIPSGEPGDEVEACGGEPECIDDGPAGSTWRFPGFALELHPSEAEGYYLNLSAPDPGVFVMWRPWETDQEPAYRPVLVTVSYNEAARMLDSGEQVDRVPLAAAIHAWLEPYMMEHYKPEPRKKVRRNDPFATAERERRGRG